MFTAGESLTFGYVRLTRPNPVRLERLRARIATYCAREGLMLELVFADSGLSDTELRRPGWTALLDVLDQSGFHTVVLPSLDHLSRDPVLRAKLRAQLTTSGAHLHEMSRPPMSRRGRTDS